MQSRKLIFAIPAMDEMAYLPATLECVARQSCEAEIVVYVCANQPDRWCNEAGKKFSTRQHLIIMFFSSFDGYNSLMGVVLGMLSNAHKLVHLGLDYMICRSTLSDASQRRSSAVFGEI